MSQTVDSPAARVSEGAPWDRTAIFQGALLASLTGLLYFRIASGLTAQWLHDANYSHGFLVPLFCAWVIWRRREQLASEPLRPSGTGLIIIVGALGELILGVVGAENFLSRTSLLFLLAGLIIYFCGWRFFRSVLFPWGVLFLMIPLPAIVFNQIALPLQFEASRLASGMLALVGVPVLREGNVIQLPSITLDVAEACSGLRSLASLITLAVIYGYLIERRIWRRVLLILVAVPIAIVANAVRIMGSGILGQYWDPDKAEGFFHLFSGWLIFGISCSLVIMFHAAFSWFDRRMHARHSW